MKTANYLSFWWRSRWRLRHLMEGSWLILTLKLSPPAFVYFWQLMERDFHYILFSLHELSYLHSKVRSLNQIDGDILEIGVYRGVSLAVMGHAKHSQDTLYGVDTFTGLPEDCSYDQEMTKGTFTQTPEAAIEKISSPNTTIIKGKFHQATDEVFNNKTFKFVHIDTDIYSATIDSLRYIHNKIAAGGAIAIHDYAKLAGVTAAVDIFLQEQSKWNIVKIVDTHVYLAPHN